jgi:methenyltetrahydromethanopterin cyclohydrolase
MKSSSEENALGKVISVNRLAWEILKKLRNNPELYGVGVGETAAGTTVIDAGIRVKGGFEAGRLITEICMGGCAKAEITSRRYGDLELPTIFVYSDNPLIATLGSQYAGWQINDRGYSAICSGPARALASKPKKIFDEIEYSDRCDKAVVVLETDKMPGQKILGRFCKDCKVTSENLAIILTPTTSVSGAIQVSGRIIETGIHKLRRLGLDLKSVLHAFGYAPIAPVHPEFAVAMARTNDAILYGGTAYYTVEYDDEEKLREIVKKAPSSTSKAYGRPFKDIFKDANFDFYKIDPDLFAPAVLIINNVKTGNTFKEGKINSKALASSFGFT